ncbi:MAG: energy-coupling factor transporter ATPase [Clostridia bacterium]|nr:energy-coupling factor transporter ATPase [Clostridia bacterium]
MIQFDHVTFRYENADEPALCDVSLRIEEGSFVAIVGHNGSGKSTLAKHINGLLLPSSGTVTVCGLQTNLEENILPIRQQVGMAFQNPDNQLVTTIVEEDVAFGPENLGIEPNEIRSRVDEALASVGMTNYAEKAVHHLSGGQKQRIAIAGILALKPRILVLDEATAMLDPSGRKELIDTVKSLHKTGMTVLMVTQYMEETTECDRIVVMNHGKVVCDDTPKAVFSEVELLAESNLVPPETVKVRNALRELGYSIPDSVLNAEQLAEAVCPLL